MKKILASLVAVALCAFSFAASAGQYSCSGTLTQLGVGQSNDVVVQMGTNPVHLICNMDTQGVYGMSPSACKSAYAVLAGAKLSGASAVIYYNNSSTCTTLSSWGSVTGVYFVVLP